MVREARKPERHRQSREEEYQKALERARTKLGAENSIELQQQFLKVPIKEQDGMILSLYSQKLSQTEVRALFKIGGHRAQRVYNLKGLDTPPLRERHTPPHALSEEDIERIRQSIKKHDIEPGYPCSHRKPFEHFADSTLTWRSIHKEYTEERESRNQKVC